jgi:hypothetical protein
MKLFPFTKYLLLHLAVEVERFIINSYAQRAHKSMMLYFVAENIQKQ